MGTKPVEVEDESGARFFCPVYRRRIGARECREFSIVPANNKVHCWEKFACACEWRYCIACVTQGLGTLSDPVVNVNTGLCEFHRRNGRTAPHPKKRHAVRVAPGSSTQEILARINHRREEVETRHLPPGGHVAPPTDPVPQAQPPTPTTAPAVTKQSPSPDLVRIGEVLEVDCSLVRPLKGQPRGHFDPDDMRSLLRSIRSKGQIQAVPAIKLPNGRFQISDGERRWRTCITLGRKLRIVVVPPLANEEEEIERSGISNFNRSDHPPLEKARLFHRLRHGPLKRTAQQLAQSFGVTQVTIDNYLMLLRKLHPEVIDLMDPSKQEGELLGMSVALQLTALFPNREKQIEMGRTIVEKKIKHAAAVLLIKKAADALGIKSGRGRESRPSDYTKRLRRALENLLLVIEAMEKVGSKHWKQSLAFQSQSSREELLGLMERARDELNNILSHPTSSQQSRKT
ncbi:MAG: ParB/RepB/Spo0J family partition protein [Patescibacteria group bacterium]